MKVKNVLDTTTNNREYKIAHALHVNHLFCWYCPPHKGCNGKGKRKVKRNWKKYRKTQWRVK